MINHRQTADRHRKIESTDPSEQFIDTGDLWRSSGMHDAFEQELDSLAPRPLYGMLAFAILGSFNLFAANHGLVDGQANRAVIAWRIVCVFTTLIFLPMGTFEAAKLPRVWSFEDRPFAQRLAEWCNNHAREIMTYDLGETIARQLVRRSDLRLGPLKQYPNCWVIDQQFTRIKAGKSTTLDYAALIVAHLNEQTDPSIFNTYTFTTGLLAQLITTRRHRLEPQQENFDG